MNWEIEIDGKVCAGCQGITAEAQGLRPGALHSRVNLRRFVITDAETFRWITLLQREDAILPENRRDLVLRDRKGGVIELRGAATIDLKPPMEMPPSKPGVLGEVTLSVNSIGPEGPRS